MSWETFSLKEITVNLDNKRKPLNESERNKISKKQLYPYLGANNIMGYVDEYLFDEEIICIAEDGGSWGENQKCCVFVNEKCWVNNHAHVLKGNGKADLKYLMYYLNATNLNSFITGSTRGKLTKSSLDSIQIPLPPLATQKRIAEILDAADALRRKDQELLKKYDELAQAIFIDMFGDPVKNEKGWDKVELSNFIARLETGVSVNSNDDKIDTIKKCVLKTSCVYTGYFNSAEAKVIVPLDLVRAKLHPVKDSIIISRMNTTELVGMSAYIDNDYPNLYLPDRLWMTVKSDKPHSTLWLSFALKSFAIREQIQKIASGTSGSMKNISKKDFLEIEIINPPYKLQRAFEDALNKINELKKYADINKGNVLFDSLIQKAFKGELVA